jgi:hypothetical protein
MRVSDAEKRRSVAGIWRRIFSAAALFSVAMPGGAAELAQTLPHLWVAATALSLTLATAASRPRN